MLWTAPPLGTCRVPVPRRGMATSPAVTIITNGYSPAIADLICERLMEGASLRQILSRQKHARALNRGHLVGLRISPTILPKSGHAGSRTAATGGR